jgi:hypothetical protein
VVNQELSQKSASAAETQMARHGLDELTMVIDLDPEVRAVAQAFDAKFGEGKFFEKAIMQGLFLEQQGQRLRPQAVAKMMAKEYSSFFPSQPAPAALAPAAQPAAAAAPAQGAPSTQTAKPQSLPNLNSSSSSPAKKKFTSTDEMRKYANSLRD